MAKVYGVPEVYARIKCKQTNHYSETTIAAAFTLDCKRDRSKFYYGIRIANGTGAFSGTYNTVYVILVGNDGATNKLNIWGMKKSTCKDLLVEADSDLGHVRVVILGNIPNWFFPRNEWYVNYSIIYDYTGSHMKEEHFPCYHWIGDGEAVSTTSATLTQQEVHDEILAKQREIEVKDRQQKYKWKIYKEAGVPSSIDESTAGIPADEQFNWVKKIDFSKNAIEAVIDLDVTEISTSIKDLSNYATFAKSIYTEEAVPLYSAGRWTSDVEFGRQILNGVNPMVIKKCTKIPPKFHVTDDLVKPFLTRGLTLDEEMNAGRVYICDLEIMDGLTPREGCFVPAPICLLYVDSNDDLVPIAIQIRQGVRKEEKSIPNPVFVPGDSWMDWILAKIYYQNAHGQLHQILTHYISCHAAMETYCVATMRNLPDAHPVNKLLRPHLRYTIAINTRARATLINDDGIIDRAFGIGGQGKKELFCRASQKYTVDFTNIKESIAQRGLEDVPKFYYRDDGLKLWEIFERLVSDIIDEFYKSDSEVNDDTELKKWAEDLHTNGFRKFKKSSMGRGFPKHIQTKGELIKQCTRIMFTGSCQHAAVNFGQYVIYSFVPNAPFALRKPPPTEKGKTSYDTLLQTLPDEKTTVLSIMITYALSQYSTDEVTLGKYPAERFVETGVLHSISEFDISLRNYEEDVKARNDSLDIPYPYLLPEKVPNSITI